MDSRGAVELDLVATELRIPPDPTRRQRQDIDRWAQTAWGVPTEFWERLQMTRLATASILLARLLHVRAERLGRFDLVPDPDRVTVAQLAALQRPHNGTAGQAFELAVAGAVSVGIPEVVEPIRDGLRRLNVHADEPLRMVALGLEKVPPDEAEVFWGEVRRLLPDDGVLRTGMRGRPASVDTAVTRLASSSWASMSTPAAHLPTDAPRKSPETFDQIVEDISKPPPSAIRGAKWGSGSQLGRADALITCGSDLVAASLKINHNHTRDAWRDVPLWITVGPARRVQSRSFGFPNVTVTLPVEGWYSYFRDALLALDEVLNWVDRGFPRSSAGRIDPGSEMVTWSPSGVIAETMWRMRNEPITAVVEELRSVHPGLRELLGYAFSADRDSLELTALDVPPVVDGWLRESETAMLFTTQRHLFRRPGSGSI